MSPASGSATTAAAATAASVPPAGTSQGVVRHASLACRSISRIVATLLPECEPGDGAGNLQRTVKLDTTPQKKTLVIVTFNGEVNWDGLRAYLEPMWFRMRLRAPHLPAHAPASAGVECPRSRALVATSAGGRRAARTGSMFSGMCASVAS